VIISESIKRNFSYFSKIIHRETGISDRYRYLEATAATAKTGTQATEPLLLIAKSGQENRISIMICCSRLTGVGNGITNCNCID
jgi:hypothetical protein